MATYYCDPAGSNDSPYETWEKAATNLQTVADLAVSGEIVYCRGTQTLTASIDIDSNSGAKFIGCNAGGTIDGTKFVLDGNSAATYCISGGADITLILLENIECKNATSHGVNLVNTNASWQVFNCDIHNNAGDGIQAGNCDYTVLVRCQIHDNTSDGVYVPGWVPILFFCAIYNNGAYGFYQTVARGAVFVGCVFHDTADNYHHVRSLAFTVHNCVFDGTDSTGCTGIYTTASIGVIVGNRFTNLGKGIDFNDVYMAYGWNLFHDNTTDILDGTLARPIPYDSDTDTNEIDPDADDGYNDVASNDFNIKADRTLRRTAIDLLIGS